MRLDVLLAERGLVESRSLAQKLILAGKVRVGGEVVREPSRRVLSEAQLSLDEGAKFVSRGGEKLEPALIAFGLAELDGRICADVGASTGGFSDCLLQHGAARVYAIDVGYGILHWKLRNDDRVVVMERTNARHLEVLPEKVTLVTIDASFISLKLILPVVRGWLSGLGADVVALIKPQFEAGREEAARGEGVIHDSRVHRAVLEDTLDFAEQGGYAVSGLVKSSLKGPKGNVEFLVHLVSSDQAEPRGEQLIEDALNA